MHRRLILVTLILIGLLVAVSNALLIPRTENTPRYTWGLIGNNGHYLQKERAAGISLKLFSLSWRRLNPQEYSIDQTYFLEKLHELRALREAGFIVILSSGLHDTPDWIHSNYLNTHYVNQFGDYYTNTTLDASTANFIFNTELRSVAEQYMSLVFALFGTDFAGVRVGGGRYGELPYPPPNFEGKSNLYWAFDPLAAAQNPVPGWLPGDASPQHEAERFLNWYLDSLVEYQTWQIDVVRQFYSGSIMVLYPSWGIRPGNIEDALTVNLDGSTSAEVNGEIQRGFDFARQIAAIDDPQVVVTTTWLDADAAQDSSTDPRYWSPVKYLAWLAGTHPLALHLFGENTGQGDPSDMALAAQQMHIYGLDGMLWYREDELLSGSYATLEDYACIIEQYAH